MGVVFNRIQGMQTVAFLLKSRSKEYPAPFKEDYGTGYPVAFCYVYNVTYPDFSEFGDCFFEIRGKHYYRVS